MTIEHLFHITLNSEERNTLKRACEILREIGGEMEYAQIDQISASQSDWTADDIKMAWSTLEDIAEAESLTAEE